MITFNGDLIVLPPQGSEAKFELNYSALWTTYTPDPEITTVNFGQTVENGYTAEGGRYVYSYRARATNDGGDDFSNVSYEINDYNEVVATQSSYESYIDFQWIGGVSTSWPLNQDNISIKRDNYVIETGFDYLYKKDIKNNNYTYNKYLLDVENTNGVKFNYRTYINSKSIAALSQATFQAITSEPIEVVAAYFALGYLTSDIFDVIYTIGYGQPGQVYHISDFNQNINGVDSYVFPVQQYIETRSEYQNEGGSYTQFGYSVDLNPYYLIPIERLYGRYDAGTILRPPENLIQGTAFVDNGQFYETYSIKVSDTFNTKNILSPNLENQLVHYNYEDQYKSLFANSQLQEFQERTLGFTYRNTTSVNELGTFFCYKAETINNKDIIRFLKPVKPSKNYTETVVGNFSMYNKNLVITLYPGIYHITKIPTMYTNKNQSTYDQVYVHPRQGKQFYYIKDSECFSIDIDEMAFWGGSYETQYEEGGEIVTEFETANFGLEYNSYPIFSTLNKYIEDNYEPDFDIDKYDSFYNSTKWFAQESTALHKLTEEGYIDGIWRCYTQEPYSSIYNTEF